jgi:hypothetical protein
MKPGKRVIRKLRRNRREENPRRLEQLKICEWQKHFGRTNCSPIKEKEKEGAVKMGPSKMHWDIRDTENNSPVKMCSMCYRTCFLLDIESEYIPC